VICHFHIHYKMDCVVCDRLLTIKHNNDNKRIVSYFHNLTVVVVYLQHHLELITIMPN
jgi:hypothetical protein